MNRDWLDDIELLAEVEPISDEAIDSLLYEKEDYKPENCETVPLAEALEIMEEWDDEC